MRSTVSCRAAFRGFRLQQTGQAGLQVPDKLGDCFLASQSGEGTGEGAGEPMGVGRVCELFLQQRLFKQQSGALYI